MKCKGQSCVKKNQQRRFYKRQARNRFNALPKDQKIARLREDIAKIEQQIEEIENSE